jgi:hypothetical protein
MNSQYAPIINFQNSQSPESAWRLWHLLNQLADALWQSYEKEFLDFCIQDAKDQSSVKSLPFD